MPSGRLVRQRLRRRVRRLRELRNHDEYDWDDHDDNYDDGYDDDYDDHDDVCDDKHNNDDDNWCIVCRTSMRLNSEAKHITRSDHRKGNRRKKGEGVASQNKEGEGGALRATTGF